MVPTQTLRKFCREYPKPLLFLIYVNDIHRNLSPGTKIRLFANDSLLYRTISDTSDSLALQNDLEALQEWERNNKMEFHPDKCQLLRISNKRKRLEFTYNIHGVNLKPHDTAKYLGITFDCHLTWNSHIDNIYKKASFMLSFLERNLHKCPPHVKERCFNALVRPLLEYGCCAWDPCKQTKIDRLERINKRAARFITGNRTFVHGQTKKNMESLQWCPLQERRSKNKLYMFYKIKNNLVHVPTDDLVPSVSSRHPNNFSVPRSRVDAHLSSFFPDTIRLWNSLPEPPKSATSLEEFKSLISDITIKSSY